METTSCPECGVPAQVQWRALIHGTDGPVEHAKVLCVRRHWLLLPAASLSTRSPGQVHTDTGVRRSRSPRMTGADEWNGG